MNTNCNSQHTHNVVSAETTTASVPRATQDTAQSLMVSASLRPLLDVIVLTFSDRIAAMLIKIT